MPMKDLGSKSEGPFTDEGEPQIFYPSIYLGKEETEALGLDNARVGQEMVMEAVVRVTSVNENEDADGDLHRSVSLDIRQAEIAPKRSTDSEKASRIFRSD